MLVSRNGMICAHCSFAHVPSRNYTHSVTCPLALFRLGDITIVVLCSVHVSGAVQNKQNDDDDDDDDDDGVLPVKYHMERTCAPGCLKQWLHLK